MIDFRLLCPHLSAEEADELDKLRQADCYRGAIYNPARLDIADFSLDHHIAIDENDPYLFRFEKSLGKTAECLAGAFYIMDPSATLVSRFLSPVENEIVLDLCAAPGGKTISYALKHPNSLIVANDISLLRVRQLRQNVERMGLGNVIITNHDPHFFQKSFSHFFDKVILDTPCSGNGMYRKEKEVEDDFSWAKLEKLLPIQQDLLALSASLVQDGGYISYSTCSFSPREDEEQIVTFLAEHRDFDSVSLPDDAGFYRSGKPGIYLFPTRYQGEGQYICLLRHRKEPVKNSVRTARTFKYRQKEYYISRFLNNYESLEPLLPGVLIHSENEKGKYSHAYGRLLGDYPNKIVLKTEAEALDYLHGDEIKIADTYKDEILVCYKKLVLGWGKAVGGRLKNYLPKGVRLITR